MKATMRDVARNAGVSVATVSHVINKTRFVTEETRKRVVDAIKKLDYSPDSMARSFKTGKRNLIGFIVPDIANNFFSTIIEKIEYVVGRENYKLIVTNTKETKSREIEDIQLLTSGIVDGLIVASTLDDYKEIKNIVPEHFPMVFIDRIIPNCPYDAITISSYGAVYKSVERLIGMGHEKIGYIAGLKRLSTTAERLRGFRQAQIDHGIRPLKSLIQYADSMAMSAYRSADLLVQSGCTAIVVSNNVMTLDVLGYLSEHRLRVNEDIRVIGYSEDENNLFLEKQIDHISQPVGEMSCIASSRLLELIKEPRTKKKDLVLYGSLIDAVSDC